MEWVKYIIGMNYFWLIRNCFLLVCFRLSLLLGINSIFLSLLSLSLCLPHCFSVFFSILKVFSLYLSLFFWCSCILLVLFSWCCLSFSLYFSMFSIWIFGVVSSGRGDALRWHRNPFHSSPTNNTSVKTTLIIFNIFTFFLLELLSVLAWVFFNKNYFTILNRKLIKRFHRVNMVFWGFVLCI